jgi:hypothetical protein
MPYKITWLEKTVLIDFFGNITVQEIIDQAAEINADLRFEDVHKAIYNCLKIKATDINKSDLKIIGFNDSTFSKYPPKAHRAFVISHDGMKITTGYYQDALDSGEWKLEVFDTLSGALAWVPD